jgi:hypothetical protein
VESQPLASRSPTAFLTAIFQAAVAIATNLLHFPDHDRARHDTVI